MPRCWGSTCHRLRKTSIFNRLETRIAGIDLSIGPCADHHRDKRASTLWSSYRTRSHRLGCRADGHSCTVNAAAVSAGHLAASRKLDLADRRAQDVQLSRTDPGPRRGYGTDGLNEAVRLERTAATSHRRAWRMSFGSKTTSFTHPSLSTGCLPGTTREFVMENLDVKRSRPGSMSWKNADAIFLTSAGLGVVAVDEFEGRALQPTRSPDPAFDPKQLTNKKHETHTNLGSCIFVCFC